LLKSTITKIIRKVKYKKQYIRNRKYFYKYLFKNIQFEFKLREEKEGTVAVTAPKDARLKETLIPASDQFRINKILNIFNELS